MEIAEICEGKSAVCQDVLDDLPEWFGIPESKADYVAISADLPMIGCRIADRTIGFVSLKVQTAVAAELYVLGVKRAFHRRGAGRALMRAVDEYARNRRLRFLTVKTIAPSLSDPHYAQTRQFYEAVGFQPVEVFPTLWGPHNPCLLMIKSVA